MQGDSVVMSSSSRPAGTCISFNQRSERPPRKYKDWQSVRIAARPAPIRLAAGLGDGQMLAKGGEDTQTASSWIPKGPWPSYLVAMALSGAALGPFLDGYHSAFGVLAYTHPITVILGGIQIFVTDWWVPELFALAAVILGVSYPILDSIFGVDETMRRPSGPAILACIGCFTLRESLVPVSMSFPAMLLMASTWQTTHRAA